MQENAGRMLELIGLRPIEVDELGQDAVIVATHGIVLIDRDASTHRYAEVAGRILTAAMGLMTG